MAKDKESKQEKTSDVQPQEVALVKTMEVTEKPPKKNEFIKPDYQSYFKAAAEERERANKLLGNPEWKATIDNLGIDSSIPSTGLTTTQHSVALAAISTAMEQEQPLVIQIAPLNNLLTVRAGGNTYNPVEVIAHTLLEKRKATVNSMSAMATAEFAEVQGYSLIIPR